MIQQLAITHSENALPTMDEYPPPQSVAEESREYRPPDEGKMDTAVAIREAFESQLAIEVPDMDTDLIDSGLLDSLAMVSLIAHIETEFSFSVDFEDLDIEEFRTVNRIAAFVARHTH